MPSFGGSNLGGGPFDGYSPAQTITNYKSGDDARMRTILRRGWNTQYARGQIGSYKRITTPFRAVNNSGDFLSRVNYSCGGPNPAHSNIPGNSRSIGSIPQQCDGTGIAPSSCNVKFVPDSSDYTTYKKQRAVNYTYNDLKFGGDNSNGSYVFRMAARRR
jgi:hypothetical protein